MYSESVCINGSGYFEMNCCDNINSIPNTNAASLMSGKTLILITLVLVFVILIVFFHSLNGSYETKFNKNSSNLKGFNHSNKRKKVSSEHLTALASYF